MKIRKQVVNSATIARANRYATEWNSSVLIKANNLSKDANKKDRLANNLCKNCYYVNTGGVSGQRITRIVCGMCPTVLSFASTDTDVMCKVCAAEHNLCKHCGADIALSDKTTRDKNGHKDNTNT